MPQRREPPPPLPASAPVRSRRVLARALLVGVAIVAWAGRAPARATADEKDVLGGPASYVPESRLAAQRREPLLVFFSLEACAYCEALRADQLRHVHARREALGVRLVEVRIDDPRPIPGLQPPRSPRQLADELKVRVSPTLVFLDGEREVAERLVGYSGPDFYGAYLDQRIAAAREATAGGGASR